MARPLSPMERGLWRVDLAAPLNFTTVARVSGPLSDEALSAALPALRARHPHLRERISDEGRFVEDGVPELQLRVGATGWVEEVESEINTRITAPLARFVRSGPYLLATLHHAIGDGMSGVYLMRDWLRAATGLALEPLEDAGGVDTLLPPVRGLSNHLRFLGRDAWLTVRHGRALKVPRDAQAFAYARRARVTPVVLEAEELERLAARARAEQTTVHGALSAAMLLGVLADAGVTRAGVQFGSPVNVRGALTRPPGEGLGFYVSMVGFRAAVRADVPFWELARAVRRHLEAELATNSELSILALMPVLFRLLRGEALAPRALVEKWERSIPTTSGLTNLGRLAVQTQFGALTLEECHFAACPSALGDFLATATSLHGRLFWNFIWADPLFTAEHSRALIDAIVARLRAAL